MSKELIDAILEYAEQAGKLALQRKHENQHLLTTLKSDNTYVTEVDMELSEAAIDLFADFVPSEHVISEERLDNLYSLDSNPSDDETIVIVDPIDGTRNYYHGIPLYGISVGVFRGRRPYLGMVTFPDLGETYYSDGVSVYMISDAYGPGRTEHVLSPGAGTLDSNSVMLFTNSYTRHYRWSYDVCTWLVTACASLNVCWPLIGRAVGTVCTDHIWDFAGAWAMLELLGFELRGFETARKLESFDLRDFDSTSLLLKEAVIVSHPEHFETLRKGVLANKTD